MSGGQGAQFKLLEFPNNAAGQRAKLRALETHSREGWRIVSETIEQGKFKGNNACCLGVGGAIACGPCGLPFMAAAGSTDGTIRVTLQRSGAATSAQSTAAPTSSHTVQQTVARNQQDAGASSMSALGMGLLKLFGFFWAVTVVSIVYAAEPWLIVLTVFAAIALVGGWWANKPAQLRPFVQTRRKWVGIGAALVALGALSGGMQASTRNEHARAEAERADNDRKAAEQRAAAEQARVQQLRANIVPATAKLREVTAELEAAIAESRWENVARLRGDIVTRYDSYHPLSNLPSDTTAALTAAASVVRAADAVIRIRDTYADAGRRLSTGQQQQSNAQFIEAHESYSAVIRSLEQIPADAERMFPGRAELLRAATRLDRTVAGKAAQQQRRRDREAREAAAARQLREAQSAACGTTAPSYYAVERYLKQSAHDPDSIDVDSCTPAVLTDRCWQMACVYRGKNAFGALIRKSSLFWLAREGTVIGSE